MSTEWALEGLSTEGLEVEPRSLLHDSSSHPEPRALGLRVRHGLENHFT